MLSRPEHVVRLSAGAHAIVVDVGAGARATSWTVDGLELLGGAGSGPVEFGMYPMAPWSGRLRGNQVTWNGEHHILPISHEGWALHGTCLDRPGRVVAQDATSVVVRFDDHPAWPWRAAVQLSWTVEPTMLVTTLAVEAVDGITFALELQKYATTACSPLRLRIGIATGDTMLFEGQDYIGTAPNLAARLCDAASDAGILLPADQVDGLPIGVEAVPHPSVALQGFDRPVDVVTVVGEPMIDDRYDINEYWTRSPFVG